MDTLQATAQPRTLYLVRVTTKNGSYSVGWDDPSRVLKAIAEFHETGFGDVGVFGLDGKKIELAAIEAAASCWRD